MPTTNLPPPPKKENERFDDWMFKLRQKLAVLLVSPPLGASALGIYYGTGAPTFSSEKGSLYIRTDGSSAATRMYVNTNGTTGWTNFTSAT